MSLLTVNPVLQANEETKGIINSDVINLNQEVPDEYKNWNYVDATSFSNQGVQFQATNTNKYLAGGIRTDLSINFELQSHTYVPAPNYTAGAGTATFGTPPILWDPAWCSVDFLGVSKLTSRLGINMLNKQWQENERFVELIDVTASQFDLKKMESMGIFPFVDQGLFNLERKYGRGKISHRDLSQINTAYLYDGGETSYPEKAKDLSPMELAIARGYIEITSTFSQGGTILGTLTDYTYSKTQQIPQSGGAVYYTNGNGQPLVQNVTIKIKEWLVCNSFSNPYTKNRVSKSYYLGNYPLNINLDFNTQYFQSMVKNLLWSVKNGATPLTGVGVVGASAIITPTFNTFPTISGASLGFYTFDSTRIPTHPYQRMLYYETEPQTMQQLVLPQATALAIANAKTVQSSTVTTANLATLPPVISGWVSMRSFENPNLMTSVEAANAYNNYDSCASYIMQKMQNLQITWGGQGDVMLGTLLTWNEICDLTQEVINNPQLNQLILGNTFVDESQSIFNETEVGTNFTSYAITDNFQVIAAKRDGMTFFAIPTARLNLRPIQAGITPAIPNFNFGSNSYKSLTIKLSYTLTQNITLVAGTHSIVYQPVVILHYPRVRSIPLSGNQAVFDERIEFDFINDRTKLMAKLAEFKSHNTSENDAQMELEFIGGAFIGSNILSKIKSWIPTFAKIVRGIHHVTRGQSGLLGDVNKVSSLASHALHLSGYGENGGARGSMRGRPRKY